MLSFRKLVWSFLKEYWMVWLCVLLLVLGLILALVSTRKKITECENVCHPYALLDSTDVCVCVDQQETSYKPARLVCTDGV